jgi:hypothetical protein
VFFFFFLFIIFIPELYLDWLQELGSKEIIKHLL